MAVIEFGNFLWNGQDRRYFKAVATLISGCRLFFWLKIRCFKGIQRLCFRYGGIIFTGIWNLLGLRGVSKVVLLYPKKNIFDWYSDVDNLLIRCG